MADSEAQEYNMKEILLTKGQVALVDNEDYDELMRYKWCICSSKNNLYAVRRISKNKTILMHNHILDSKMADHRDHNGLNNQKNNIRPCNQSQNNMNTRKKPRCSSKFKGVVWDLARQKWAGYITKDGVTYRLGRFILEKEAALAYNQKATELHGEFAQLNEV